MYDFGKQMREMGPKQGRVMRDRARITAMKRKEEYLGARVPKDLREKVIAKADSLGIPVSILIRNILEEAFSAISTQGNEATRAVPTSAKSNREFPNIIGWEEIRLNRDMKCSSCNSELRPGSVVTLGVGAPKGDHVILCENCRDNA